MQELREAPGVIPADECIVHCQMTVIATVSCRPWMLMLQCRLHMQANEGENKTERPMWAEKGGLDFEGRARWDAWTANKGMAAEKAKLLFVKVRRLQWPHGSPAINSGVGPA